MEYPTVPSCVRLNKRDQVRLDRQRAAWDLVKHRFGEVDDSEYERAYGLLSRCIRYALAQCHLDETETEHNWASKSRIHKQELLDKREERLNKELEHFDATLGYASWWPCVIDKTAKEERHQFVVVARLYDFD